MNDLENRRSEIEGRLAEDKYGIDYEDIAIQVRLENILIRKGLSTK